MCRAVFLFVLALVFPTALPAASSSKWIRGSLQKVQPFKKGKEKRRSSSNNQQEKVNWRGHLRLKSPFFKDPIAPYKEEAERMLGVDTGSTECIQKYGSGFLNGVSSVLRAPVFDKEQAEADLRLFQDTSRSESQLLKRLFVDSYALGLRSEASYKLFLNEDLFWVAMFWNKSSLQQKGQIMGELLSKRVRKYIFRNVPKSNRELYADLFIEMKLVAAWFWWQT